MSISMIPGFQHYPALHGASGSLQDVLRFFGLDLDEALCFGLGCGWSFSLIEDDRINPPLLISGKSNTIESDCLSLCGCKFTQNRPDAETAWEALCNDVEGGVPVMVLVHALFLPWQVGSFRFRLHRTVCAGVDRAESAAFLADSCFPGFQKIARKELGLARMGAVPPFRCDNDAIKLSAVEPGYSLDRAIMKAIHRAAERMLSPLEGVVGPRGKLTDGISGVEGIERLARIIRSWDVGRRTESVTNSAYGLTERLGSDDDMLRELYAEFLARAASECPPLRRRNLADRMRRMAGLWREAWAMIRELTRQPRTDIVVKTADLLDEIVFSEMAFAETAVDLTRRI